MEEEEKKEEEGEEDGDACTICTRPSTPVPRRSVEGSRPAQ